MSNKSPALVVCESIAACIPHLRLIDDSHPPVSLSGCNPNNQSFALCGIKTAWDTQLPIGASRCRGCRSKAEELGMAPSGGWR